MFQQAGIEIVLIILWVLFSIYGSIQQKKKRELAKQQPPRPQPKAEEEAEDPFKKMMEEMFGDKQQQPEVITEREVVREVSDDSRPFHEQDKPRKSRGKVETYKKTVYESIPLDRETPTLLENDYDLRDTGDTAYTPLTSMLLPSEEGQPQTFGKEAKRKTKSVQPVKPRSTKVLINGKPMSMKEVVVAQTILERKF